MKMILRVSMLLLVVIFVSSTLAQNTILEKEWLFYPENGEQERDSIVKTTSIRLDGLGKIRLSANIGSSPQKQDMIHLIDYDDRGSKIREYLPIEGDARHSLADHIQSQELYYRIALRTAHTAFPYSDFRYDASPIASIIEQSAPGYCWSLGQGHTERFYTRLNTSDEVRNLLWTSNGLLDENFYPPGTIWVEVHMDEDGLEERMFYSGEGNLILRTRAGSNAQLNETYFIYDRKGELRAVLQPKAVEQMKQAQSFALSVLQEDLIFYYQYDALGRQVIRKHPGAGPVFIVYDRLGRPVFRQDAVMRTDSVWDACYYDEHGRLVEEGRFKDLQSLPRSSWQSRVDTFFTQSMQAALYSSRSHGSSIYNHPPFIAGTSYQAYRRYFFDDHLAIPLSVADPSLLSGIKPDHHGLMTGKESLLLDGTLSNWIQSKQALNEDHFPIYVFTEGVDGSYAESYIQPDLQGQTIEEIKKWSLPVTSISSAVPEVSFQHLYDHAGRLKKRIMQIGSSETILAEAGYNGTGQLVEVDLGSSDDGQNFLQSIDYSYNPRQWLTHINNAALTNDRVAFESIFDNSTETLEAFAFEEISLAIEAAGNEIEIEFSDEAELSFESGNNQVQFITSSGEAEHGIEEQELDSVNLILIENLHGEQFVVDFQGLQLVEGLGTQAIIDSAISVLVSELQSNGISEPDVVNLLCENLASYISRRIGYAWFNDDSGDLWGMELKYESPNSSHPPSYNGAIAQLLWRSPDTLSPVSRYDLSYDYLNRLTSAAYLEKATLTQWAVPYTDYSCGPYIYDANGNITAMIRKGMLADQDAMNNPVFGVIDNLQMSYDGNLLQSVNEYAQQAEPALPGFHSQSSQALIYDDNARLLYDPARALNIIYNEIGLATQMNFGGLSTVLNLYDASGNKHKESRTHQNQLSERIYLGELILEEGITKIIRHPHGRLTFDGNQWLIDYDLVDHLGNVRLSFRDTDGDHVPELIQENSYYPFGMAMGGRTVLYGNTENSFLYNGKERIREGGFEYYDYGARYYDPALARWHVADPLIDMHPDYSPFAYVYNNPFSYTDPFGLDSAERAVALQTAQEFIDLKKPGNQYRMGAKGSPGNYVDCSGLVSQCIKSAGFDDPNYGGKGSGVLNIEGNTHAVEEADVKPGYIISFRNTRDGAYKYHIGIVTEVIRNEKGEIVSIEFIHSSGGVGPNKVTRVVDAPSTLEIHSYRKWDSPDPVQASPVPETMPQPRRSSPQKQVSPKGADPFTFNFLSSIRSELSFKLSLFENWIKNGY